MSIADKLSERAKYTYYLQLSHEQIRAVETGDIYEFDRILLAKNAIIATLHDARPLIADDPSLANIIDQIKQTEVEAQEILQRKMSSAKKKLTEMQQQKAARRAYRRYTPLTTQFGFKVAANTPRFIDRAF